MQVVQYEGSESNHLSAKQRLEHTDQVQAISDDINCVRFDFSAQERNVQLLSETLPTHINHKGASDVVNPFALITLHACGDLSPSTLHMFTDIPNATVLINVGCCYQAMSVKGQCASAVVSNEDEDDGAQVNAEGEVPYDFNAYPMSDLLKSAYERLPATRRCLDLCVMRQASQHFLRKQNAIEVNYYNMMLN